MRMDLQKTPMKIRKMIIVSLVATLLTSCLPAAKIPATATIVPSPTITPAPTSTPIAIIPTKQLIEPKLDAEIQIKFGESVTLEKGRLKIKFKSVVGDYNIQLRDVIPYPKAGEELKPEDYSVKIVVSKR